MSKVRIISYNIYASTCFDSLIKILEGWKPDCIVLQNIASNKLRNSFLDKYNPDNFCYSHEHLLVISRYKIKAARFHRLGNSASCICVDICVNGRFFTLINIVLGGHFKNRPFQVKKLLADVVNTLPVAPPTMLAGDFGEVLGISCHYKFNKHFRRIYPSVFRSTYPASCPVFSRDRIYISYGLSGSNIHIDYSKLARIAAKHLPVIADVEIVDNRVAVLEKKTGSGNIMEAAPS